MALTLAARLLCASNLAYAVKTQGPVPPVALYSGALAFTTPPVGFVAGALGIDACLVGTNSDGVIVAFRGTLPFTAPNHKQMILDWANDLALPLIQGKGLPGLVHQGFCGALDSLWLPACTEVNQQFAAAMNKALYITGHSKGGAVANLAAARFSLTEGMSPHVCTFAAAHPGDESFAKAYDKAVIDSTRYEYADDIVPHLPPSPAFGPLLERIAALRGLFGKLAYAHVGQLRFIDWSGDVIDDQPFLDVKRFAKLLELLTQLKFDEIVDDHAIDDPQSGYMKAIIPSGL